MTAESGPLYHEYRKNVPNRSGTKGRSSSIRSNAAHTGPPSTNPAPDTTTRPPLHRVSSQSPVRPPNNAPSAPPASPQTPNCRPTAATGRPWVRSKKLGAQAIRPFTAKGTSAPPPNNQISVGGRSTGPAAWRKTPDAVAATSVASVVPRTATGTSPNNGHTMPMLTQAEKTAESGPRGRGRNKPSAPATPARSAAD